MVDLKRASKNTYETVVKIALRYKPKKILDLGSGKGGLIKQLYDAGLNVTASDMDTEQFKVPNVTCLKIDLNKKFIVPGKYDLITCTEVIEHVENPKKLLVDVYNLLEKNGILILSTPNNQNWFSRLYFLFTGELPMMDPHPDHISPIFTGQLAKLISELFKLEGIQFNRSVVPLIHINLPIKNLFFGQNLIFILRKI
ncbi:TPA: class I SAM-dependent methyltransferase [Candidatus Woesearchaeota archaeon]|nr:class I SAM-dependent methyltransferase [Candidatus Woesearchaeota archaeon]HIH39521.1 class I SAM-dependent methyltransferase [Candidatus Woesearchaeota archaeon]